ncbi:MAG: hypothetical protein M1817_000831 [Caeruleum heppii]|nr:MAG: hypothetical protein M1817_000831 [Caeruleum heppii]
MDTILHIQGDVDSPLTPLFLIHAISGIALPYFALGSLTGIKVPTDDGRPVYGISSPIFSSRSYPLPGTFGELARQYVALIRRDIQPDGPYLLGGWSMGGMIAIKMAEILQQQGEQVLHVLMVDSANPESHPAFADVVEHEGIASLTYSAIVKRMNVPATSVSANESEPSSEEDDDGLANMLPRMRRHVVNGVQLVANARPSQFLTQHCHTSVTLIKCTSLSKLSPTLRESRRAFVRKCFGDDAMCWRTKAFDRFRTIKFDAQHDSAFDVTHVGDLTRLMRGVLAQIP